MLDIFLDNDYMYPKSIDFCCLNLYGFLEFFKHINIDDINFPCWTSSISFLPM